LERSRASIVQIHRVPILNVTIDEALDLIEGCIDRGERRSVFFVNAHCINVSAGDAAYRGLLAREDAIVFGDGIGIRIAGWLSRQPLRDNVNGTDLFPLLCQRAAQRGWGLFLLGAQPGVADEAARRITLSYPGLRVAGVRHGYFDEAEADALLRAINASGAHVLLVALGVPGQERWIAAHRESLKVPVAMGVGGLFDYYSGRIPRAPSLLRKASLEWAWRLAMEPGRMWRRYLVGNIAFMGRVLWWSLTRRKAAD
jgi:N-acetylglucosaminyldiphosphoundecaprenol N-acetyl-beta-D-mannosaminyltransferase